MIYKADLENLDDVLAKVENVLDEAGAPMKSTMAFLVAVEEIFVNVASYAYPDGEGEVDIELVAADGVVKITFDDTGIEFDPLAKPDPDVKATAEERPIGGLGIYMVKKSMDGVDYKRKDGHNILTFWKNI